jgi:hypothetical protein
MKRFRWWIPAIVLLVVLVGAVGVWAGSNGSVPYRLVSRYPASLLAEEATTMHECAECHDADTFHRCDTCHDDHGALELSEVPFYAVVAFEGDVPAPGYVRVDDVLPYRDQPNTLVGLIDFLATQGVQDFESVTLASDDGGFVTISRDNLTDRALLMPYEDGIRFAAEDLHVSAWIKGIRRIIVVGRETPIRIEGQSTSIGRLLLGPTEWVTVEETDVMLKSEEDGTTRKAQVGTRIRGASLATILPSGASGVVVETADGASETVTAGDLQGALLAQLRGEVTLVFPARGRTQWITGVTALDSE